MTPKYLDLDYFFKKKFQNKSFREQHSETIYNTPKLTSRTHALRSLNQNPRGPGLRSFHFKTFFKQKEPQDEEPKRNRLGGAGSGSFPGPIEGGASRSAAIGGGRRGIEPPRRPALSGPLFLHCSLVQFGTPLSSP